MQGEGACDIREKLPCSLLLHRIDKEYEKNANISLAEKEGE
jgi:hypothetical protein